MASHDAPPIAFRLAGLPRRLTPFVGRQADLETLVQLLREPSVRLITLLGAGGVGKTALALELASRLQASFRHGAVFVPLAHLDSVEQILPTLADALDVQVPSSTDLQQAVLDQIRPLEMLLVLDNFEQLLKAAMLVRSLLLTGPAVKIVVTSREKLDLEAETLYPLGGLDLPAEAGLPAIGQSDAVRLFLQKARQVRPRFSLDNGNSSAIVQICAMVDGNPLGILLAASWIEHFSPAEIANQASRSLDFLSRESRDAEQRHSSMRAVFESSFRRLDAKQQTIFRKLAVFRGGFDLAAAQAVASADLGSLIALVEKSMLTRIPETGRYDLHVLLRQYAGQELSVAGDDQTAAAAHAAYYAGFVTQREPHLISDTQRSALDEMQTDLENIRLAWSTTVDRRDFAAAGAMIPGLYAFCDMRSRFYDGEPLFRLAAERLAPQAGESPHGTWALALLSWFDMHASVEWPQSFETITAQARACLMQAERSQDAQAMAASLVLLGAIAHYQEDFDSAIGHYESAMQHCPALDDVYWVNMRIGLVYQWSQQYSEAVRAFAGCLRRGQETGERLRTAWSLQNLGDTLMLQGKAEEAETHLERAFGLFQQLDTRTGMMWSAYSLGRVALALHGAPRAREFAETAAQLARQTHSSAWMRKVHELLAHLDSEGAQSPLPRSADLTVPLSGRELEVLRLLESDLTGPEIAERLVISLNTVRFHTKQIYQKLGVNSRLQAIQRARELGL